MSKLFSTPKSKALIATLTSVTIFAIVLSLTMWLTIVAPAVTLITFVSILGLFFIKQIYDKFLEDYEEDYEDEKDYEDYEDEDLD